MTSITTIKYQLTSLTSHNTFNYFSWFLVFSHQLSPQSSAMWLIFQIVLNTYRAALSAEVPPGEVPLPMSPSNQTGSSALDEAMAKTLAAIDPNLANSIPIPEESKCILYYLYVKESE